jgi:hypothetical protein
VNFKVLLFAFSGTPSSVQPGRVFAPLLQGRLDGNDLLVTAPNGLCSTALECPPQAHRACDDFNVFKSTIKTVLFDRRRLLCTFLVVILAGLAHCTFVFFYSVKRPWQI